MCVVVVVVVVLSKEIREGLLLAATFQTRNNTFLRTFLAPVTFLALKEEIAFELRKNDSFNDTAAILRNGKKSHKTYKHFKPYKKAPCSCCFSDMVGSDGDTAHKKASIYTRTGDTGNSALFNGERRSKDDLVFEALGNTDELNASLGVAKEYCISADNGLAPSLSIVQSRLLDLGSAIATPRTNTKSDARIERTSFPEEHVFIVESWIDELDAQLPQLKNFILPSGGLCSSHLHVARAI